jgi:uncharacterized DUF497 family protein
MKFEWHEIKNKTNLTKHGVDFNYVISVFLDKNRIEWEDTRKEYGEIRYITIGMIDEMIYTLVYTCRKEYYRLISARGARKDERQAYYLYLKSNE